MILKPKYTFCFFGTLLANTLSKETVGDMRHLILILIALGIAVLQVTAKKLHVDFLNTHQATCAVYLDNEYLGRMKAGDNLHTKIKKGEHTLSFIVIDDIGNYYTYVRDLDIHENNSKFMLLTNDSGYVHIEKFEGVNPLVVKSIKELPVLDDFKLEKALLNALTLNDDIYKSTLITQLISEHRIATHNLRDMLDHLCDSKYKADIAQIAYQHIIDKHNFHHILFSFDEESAKKIERHTAMVNRYI